MQLMSQTKQRIRKLWKEQRRQKNFKFFAENRKKLAERHKLKTSFFEHLEQAISGFEGSQEEFFDFICTRGIFMQLNVFIK